MKLNEFVENVLVQILDGITKAQATEKIGAFIVPNNDGGHKYPENSRCSSSARLKSTIIDFDVAITVENNESIEGSGTLKIAGIGGDAKGKTNLKDTQVSRVQFGIPILLPVSNKSWHEEQKDK